ncbi:MULTISPECIES: hypothetical protein [Xanthomonas]|uniref:hypothetical protein n=1 Tax=Xanthomonas TaxID=338 RepID=UPI00052832E3|nr:MULTISPECIES: hypothetical protein [Xanthomonas]MBO9859135.1 hypothetical protein [Xanthomonas sp. A1809]PNV30257.1 hypothetical protein xavtCFBP7764_00285 [Xanthomonas citri]WPM78379.1 hypothetical protein XVT_09600 [Xanthomonas citri pv. viticola]
MTELDNVERFKLRNRVLLDVEAELTDDDKYHVGRYKLYRAIKNHIPRLPSAPYHDPLRDLASLPGAAMVFSESLGRALRELANHINTFGSMIRKLEAWDLVIEHFDNNQIFSLSLEHIEPLANLAISATQSIRGQLIFAVVECGALANSFLGKEHGWEGKSHVDMLVAKKVAGHWSAWPAMAAALSDLQVEELNEASSNFRNDYQHGAPRSLIIGVTTRTTWIDHGDGNLGWGIGNEDPIRLKEIIPHLKSAHSKALKALDAFHELSKEWAAAMPPIPQ